MSPEEKITKARVQMISKQPFFGVLCMSLRFKPDPNQDTAAVTPYGVVYYNPDYIKKLTTEQVKGLICHEVMHVALRHLEREEGRDHFKANIAQDLAINPLILQTFQLPPGALYMREYEGMSWEEIYDKLPDPKRFECNGDCDNCPFKQKNPNGYGGVPSVVVVCRKRGSLDKHITRKDIEEARRKVEDGVISKSDLDKLGIPKGALDDKETVNWRKVLKDAWHHAKSMGKAPLGIERLIEDLVEPQINWLEYLPQLIVRHMPYDYTYSRPSKKSIAAGYYLPSVLKSGIKGVVVIDTSGSMSMGDLRDGLSEIIGIFREVPNAELTIYSCDTMLYEAQTITSEYDLNTLQLKGGGGTDFRPIFQKIQEDGDDVDLLIYITDGYGEYPTPDMINPNMTVIWVITRDGDETRVPDYFDLVVKIK